MKRINVVIICVLFCSVVFAQKGNNQIGIGADVSLPTGQFSNYYKTSFGGYAKAMLGVGKSGQVTFTTGYSSFQQSVQDVDFTTAISIVPLLLGYRANFNGFFVEPQLGYGVYGGKFLTADGDFFSKTTGSFMWAAGIGYVFNKKVEVSARYQVGSKNGTALSVFGLRLGYNFSLNSSKK